MPTPDPAALPRYGWLPQVVLAAGLAGCLDLVFTLEWWFPGCRASADGPVGGVVGLPLPYLEGNIGVSLGFHADPVLYVVGQVCLAAAIFTPLWIGSRNSRARGSLAGGRWSKTLIVGVVLWAISATRIAFLLMLGIWTVAPLRQSPAELLEFRPAGFVGGAQGRCTGSVSARLPPEPEPSGATSGADAFSNGC